MLLALGQRLLPGWRALRLSAALMPVVRAGGQRGVKWEQHGEPCLT